MQKTGIEWADYSWNPIRGSCPVNCKLPDDRSYCYARKMYNRFGWKKKISYEMDDMEAIYKLQNKNIPDGSRVFICSTFEIFHPSIKKEQVDLIFQVIELNPKITFIILTKLPQNIDREMPDNVWLGVSITENKDIWRKYPLEAATAKIKFISFEPLLERINLGEKGIADWLFRGINWIIIGKLTGHGNEYDPKSWQIESIVNECVTHNIPIFLKNNLRGIWGGELLQEFPKR